MKKRMELEQRSLLPFLFAEIFEIDRQTKTQLVTKVETNVVGDSHSQEHIIITMRPTNGKQQQRTILMRECMNE